MTPMRRLLVVDQGVGVWGAQRHLVDLARELDDWGVELVLGAPEESELAVLWRASGRPGVDVALPRERVIRDAGTAGSLDWGALGRQAAVSRRIVADIRAAARVCGAHAIVGNGHGIHLETAVAARREGLVGLLHLHEEVDARTARVVRMLGVLLATRSIAVSEAVRHGVPSGLRRRVDVVPNAVDVASFAPGTRSPSVRRDLGSERDDEVVFVTLARVDPEKRIEDAIRAAAHLPRDLPWRLAVVGETSHTPEYEREVIALGERLLGERFRFVGRRCDVADVLRAADALVHTGVVEGMPIALLEAQAAGLPAVAYAVAGVPEVVQDGVNGLLVPPGDTRAMSAQMQTLLADPAFRARVGAAGRASVVAGHALEVQGRRYAAVVLPLVGAAGDRPAGAVATAPDENPLRASGTT